MIYLKAPKGVGLPRGTKGVGFTSKAPRGAVNRASLKVSSPTEKLRASLNNSCLAEEV